MNKRIIDWSHGPIHTAIKKHLNSAGWALTFCVLGVVLLLTGAAVVSTWPLKGLPFGHIVLGEPQLALGGLDVGLAFYSLKRWETLQQSDTPVRIASKDCVPFGTLVAGFGLSIIGVASGAYRYMVLAAPEAKPNGADFAQDHPPAENVGTAMTFLFVGIAALLTVLCLSDFGKDNAGLKWYRRRAFLLRYAAGGLLGVGSALAFYFDIGLIAGTVK